MYGGEVRRAVWDALQDADRLARYCGILSERHRRYHLLLRFTLLFAAVGGISRFTEIIPLVPDWLPEASAVLIIALVILDFMAENGRKADVLYAIAIECGAYELRLNHLMRALQKGSGAGDEEDVWRELREIETGLIQSTARAGYANIGESKRANDRAWMEAREVVSGRFATESGDESPAPS